MDEMFVPYKEMFHPPPEQPRVRPEAVKESGNWNYLLIFVFVGLGVAIGIAWYYYYMKDDEKPFRQVQGIPFHSIPNQLDLHGKSFEPKVERVEPKASEPKAVEPKAVEPKVEKTEPRVEKVEPKVEKMEPKVEKVEPKVEKVEPKVEKVEPKVEPKVEKVEEKKVEVVEYKSPHELAKGVGTKIRDVLLTHKQIPPLAVAAIVSSTVKVLLGENDRPQIQEEEKEEEKPPEAERKEVESDEEPVKDLPRRGKINADTDTNLLKLLKQRGLKA